ncbi:hypothetical protein BFP72_04065 [Reichenbachiella sp. 5M10]|uniref:glycosyltransferase family 2 protein n=1 Tax=Reichenbachiella sp. 5M10 TaxID=1889772 RepID=UPI000C154AF7|nr:glycosyltransferase family 2 protein [Reichenbachiella sp. 5M10]PIB34642.1 hypothetical protein BFP72_04065 [Reichenbachiella sp. 5M10]
MPAKQPLISIISVNYNEPEETLAFLGSVYQSDYPSFETILVDNGSKRKIDRSLEQQYPNLTCIIHEENLGFAGGNNLGIKAAKGKYLVFLNNDTLIPTDFLTKMVAFMVDHPEAGIASPKVIYPNGMVQYAGAKKIHPLTGRGKRIGLMETDRGQFNCTHPTDLPHGAAMIIPKKIIEQVGHMPEEYFLYYEEHDWCMKIQHAGYKMFYFGDTHVVHKESISVGVNSPLQVYYMNRNRLLFQRRNTKGLPRVCGILFYGIFAFPKQLIQYVSKGMFHHAENLVRGTLWHLNKNYDYKG